MIDPQVFEQEIAILMDWYNRISHKLRWPKICQESDLDGVKLIADKL